MSTRITSIIGIPVKIHYTLFIGFFLIVWTLASGYMPREYPGLDGSTYWVIGVLSAFILFSSVLLHELGHSYVAKRNGIPIVGIVLFIFGGIAQLGKDVPDPKTELKITAGGPAVSYILAAALGGSFLLARGLALSPMIIAPLEYGMLINGLIATFNLVPAFPLDGGRILRAFLWARKKNFLAATHLSTRVGVAFAYIMMMFGLFEIVQGGFIGGLWFVFIGWFLRNGAEGTYRQAELAETFAEVKVKDIMTKNVDTVPTDASLYTLVEQHFWKKKHGGYPVVDQGRLVGIVTIEDVRKIPTSSWEATSIKQVMTPVDKLVTTNPDAKAIDVLMELSQRNLGRMPVLQGETLVGIITRSDLVHAVRLRQVASKQSAKLPYMGF